MISLEQAEDQFPIGTRVTHTHLSMHGTVAARPADRRPGGGLTYDTDTAGQCCGINVDWDGKGHLWTPPNLLRKFADLPVRTPMQALAAGLASFNETLRQGNRIMSAQAAMGWAYRGDLDALRDVLAGMEPEQLQEVSAAAALLAS